MDYVREYQMRHPQIEPELLSLETREGADMARLYDVTRYPAVLVISQDGRLQQLWQEAELPLMGELEAYTYSY